jgi:hypothetical protein
MSMSTLKARTILCCLVSLSLCGGAWKENGKPVPDTAWAKSDGDFVAQLVLSDTPNDTFKKGDKPEPAALLSGTRKVLRGTPIVAVVYFAGCAPDAKGNCDATVRFTAQAPDGKPWSDPIEGELWLNKLPPGKGQMQLSVKNMGILIETGDALGVYKVRADIEDKVAKKKLVLEREFTAVEAPGGGSSGSSSP